MVCSDCGMPMVALFGTPDMVCWDCGTVSRNSAETETDRVQGWLVGLNIPGCLFDSVRGPYDTESEAIAAIPECIEDYGNPNYVGDVFYVDMTAQSFEEYIMGF